VTDFANAGKKWRIKAIESLIWGKTMRTLFEDTDLKADLEDQQQRGKESKSMLVVLWMVALLFLGGTWSVYQWAIKQPAPTPPPPPVSLDDPKQTTEIIGRFLRFAKEENWTEAQNLLSAAAQQRLSASQVSLRDSLQGNYKNLKLYEAITTSSVDRSEPGKLRQDCNLFFSYPNDPSKAEQKIVPIALVIDNGRLAIDGWEGQNAEELKKADELKKAEEAKKAEAPKK
jgi:hypothetical protein